MSDAIKNLHDYLAKSPSVVYPEDVLAYLPAIEDENAELRERGAKTLEVGTRWMAKAARLESENTKLRELARELWTYAEQELLCDENCSYGAVCDWKDCVFERLMRELGVEAE